MLGGECVFNTCVALLSQARDLQEQSHMKALKPSRCSTSQYLIRQIKNGYYQDTYQVSEKQDGFAFLYSMCGRSEVTVYNAKLEVDGHLELGRSVLVQKR